MLARLTELVKPYDITLSEGLRFVGNDLRQYARIAEYLMPFITDGTTLSFSRDE